MYEESCHNFQPDDEHDWSPLATIFEISVLAMEGGRHKCYEWYEPGLCCFNIRCEDNVFLCHEYEPHCAVMMVLEEEEVERGESTLLEREFVGRG